MIRFLTAGESHGPALTAMVEGFPAQMPLTAEAIDGQLARRQQGYGRGGRMKIETDRVRFTSGVRGGKTLGSPITMVIENKDWANWSTIMAPGPEADLTARKVTKPRPGHADLTGALKYGHEDVRNVLERSSARETAARVAVGAVARQFLEACGIELFSHVIRIGSARAENLPDDWSLLRRQAAASETACACPVGSEAMKKAIDQAKADGDTLGGVFEVIALGLPPGLGSYVQWDRKLDARLAQAVMSIQAIKGVEFGIGFEAGTLPGSQVHDEIFHSPEAGYYRLTNRAGGVEGGMTNGSPLILRAVMKPIPTLYKPLRSVDMETKAPYEASVERSDACAVPAAAVVAEGAVAWEIAAALLEKFGGDTMDEIADRLARYRRRTKE